MIVSKLTSKAQTTILPVSNLASAGLPVASVIRSAKIATIEAADAAKLGRVPGALFRQVAGRLAEELGLNAGRD